VLMWIIGGGDGSIAFGANKLTRVDKYESHYITITRNEYETALKKNIPVYVFIDKNVYSEYQTFSENKVIYEELIGSKKTVFKFAHVDSLRNCLNFIF